MLFLVIGVCCLYTVTARYTETDDLQWSSRNSFAPEGGTAELRCSHDYRSYRNIEIGWSNKNRSQIYNSSKFQITSYFTVGYCAITNISDSLAIGSGIDTRTTSVPGERNDDFICVNSILRIANTTENDYGMYKCIMKNVKYYYDDPKYCYIMLGKNTDTSEQIVYRKTTYNENTSLPFVKHCIAQGSSPITWKITFAPRDCFLGRSCLEEGWIDLKDIYELDKFVSLPYQVNSTFNGFFAESILRVSFAGWALAGKSDDLIVFCVTEDATGTFNTSGSSVFARNRHHFYRNKEILYHLPLEIILPLSCFFGAGLLVAMIRSRCCHRAPDCVLVALGNLVNRALQAREQHVYMVIPTNEEGHPVGDPAMSDDSMILNAAD